MALIGAAFGLGFILGPALGGGLAWGASHFVADPRFGMKFAAGFVGLICLGTWIFAYFKLLETRWVRPASGEVPMESSSRWARLGKFLQRPVTGRLIGSFFINSFAFSLMEATLVLYVADQFGWGQLEVSLGFVYIGVLSALNQGFLVRRLLPLYGERFLLRLGLGLMVASFALTSVAGALWILALAMTLLSFGNSFTNPSLLGAVSLTCSSHEQGEALGTTQGTASLGRILGPPLGGLLYSTVGAGSPFLFSSFLCLVSWCNIWSLGSQVPDSAKVKSDG